MGIGCLLTSLMVTELSRIVSLYWLFYQVNNFKIEIVGKKCVVWLVTRKLYTTGK